MEILATVLPYTVASVFVSAPIVYTTSEVLCDGSGAVLTPGGLLQYVEYANRDSNDISITKGDIAKFIIASIARNLVRGGMFYMASKLIDSDISFPNPFKMRR